MVSKTSLLEAVKAFDWKALDAGLQERPDLLGHRDARFDLLERDLALVLEAHAEFLVLACRAVEVLHRSGRAFQSCTEEAICPGRMRAKYQ